jgi:pimeloyl-ACP methyl ester carboxylesterase
MTFTLTTAEGTLAYDDTGGDGAPLLLLPGAGDVRSEYRFLGPLLAAQGYRVVTADLRGHGDTSPSWKQFGMAATSRDILALIRHLDAGPATIVANSFAPAAALWAAAEAPEAIRSIVAISPHIAAGGSTFQKLALQIAMRGPWAAPLWARFYRSWYKGHVPDDLDREIAKLTEMMRDRDRRRAARETLVAHRNGIAERIAGLKMPVLAVFGSADDHFPDPEAEAHEVAAATKGRFEMVDGAGHYPHVEQPQIVADMVTRFLVASR